MNMDRYGRVRFDFMSHRRAGPGPARPPTPHFDRKDEAGPARNPSLLSTSLGRSSRRIPHFCRQALGQPSQPKSLIFVDGFRPAQSLTSLIGQTPLLLSAGANPVTPAGITSQPRAVPPEQQPPGCPGLGPSLFGKPSCDFTSSM